MDFKFDLNKFKNVFSKFNFNFDMFAKPLTMSISIDDDFKSIKVLKHDTEEKTYTLRTENYKGKPFNDNFYEMLKGVLSLLQYERAEKVAFILPDRLFVNDTIKLPYIQKSALNTSLGLALDALYGEKSGIKFNNFILSQNKQHAIFNVFGIKKDILNKIYDCLDECSVPVSEVTFAANANTNAAMALNPKLRNSNFILLDIKKRYSRFSFVVNGKTVGFYSLPFGFEILATDKVNNEITLFDHTPADLLVLNAQETAKKKQLTMLDTNEQDEADDDDGLIDNSDTDEFGNSEEFIDTLDSNKSEALFKRVNRKLPKFMQRPEPQSSEQFIYENFRVFIKWTLELVRNNSEIFSFGAPDFIVVNLPSKFSSLFPMNISGTDVEFVQLPSSNSIITNNLELYGGLYSKKFNKVNNF